MPATTLTQVQDLRDARANIWNQMVDIMDNPAGANGTLSAEQVQTYDRLEKDLDEKGDEITRAEAHAKRAEEFGKVDRSGVVAPPEDAGAANSEKDKAYADAFATYMRRGIGALAHDKQELLRTGWVENPQNAQGTGTGAAGGYTVPPAFRQKLVERMNFMAVMRQLAEVISTDTGATLPWPTADDTGNEGAILAENTQVTEQDVTFGQANLDAYMYTSKLVRVSFQLLQDNAFNLEAYLIRILGARIGRIQNRHFTIGTGTGQPDGIVTSAQVGVEAAAVAAISTDDLVNLTESLDPAYLEGGDNHFMMAQATRGALRKLKDSQNRPLWEPSLQAGSPDRLMGYGLRLNNYMAAPAASAKTVLFGNVREAYVIRDVADFALLRLAERYADYLQVGFIGFQRSDGTMQNTDAIKALQQKAS